MSRLLWNGTDWLTLMTFFRMNNFHWNNSNITFQDSIDLKLSLLLSIKQSYLKQDWLTDRGWPTTNLNTYVVGVVSVSSISLLGIWSRSKMALILMHRYHSFNLLRYFTNVIFLRSLNSVATKYERTSCKQMILHM